MLDRALHLRDRRIPSGSRSGLKRLAATGGIAVLVVGAAFFAPLAPTVLAPVVPPAAPGDQSTPAPASVPVVAAVVPVVPPVAAIGAVPSKPAPAPAPVAAPKQEPAPAPVAPPTLSPSGQAVLSAINADMSAHWFKNQVETPLRSGPSDDAVLFTRLPQASMLKQLETRPGWTLVLYGGDGATREPGPGWVRASDITSIDAPAIWLRESAASSLWSGADQSAKATLSLPAGTIMEVSGPGDVVQSNRVHVRLPGDGRSVPPAQGWVDANALNRVARPPTGEELPRAYPDDLRADVRINVPYRTQLDGSDYADANCGPTTLGMALESFGMNLAAPDVRHQVLDAEKFDPTDDNAGSFIWALARVAQRHGLQANGLYDADGSLHHWTVDEIRAKVRQNQPVIVQVVYRGLPGREESGYYGDHYVIVTGLMGDKFLYNDPIGGAVAHEAPGYDRVMTAAELQRAMHASDVQYAFSAFSLSR